VRAGLAQFLNRDICCSILNPYKKSAIGRPRYFLHELPLTTSFSSRAKVRAGVPQVAVFDEAPAWIMQFINRIKFRVERQRALVAELLKAESRQAQILPVSVAQQRLWFLAQLEPATAAYNIWVGLRLHGILNRAVLERSLQAIIDRHESLRTTFEIRNAEPVQVIAPKAGLHLAFTDLSSFPATQSETEAYGRAAMEAGKSFDLKEGPLFRAALFRLAPEHHILICVMHHIVSDGWSAGVLVQELVHNYEEFSKRRDYRPEPLTIQYGDYASWQRQFLTAELLDRQLGYWKSKLAGSPPVLNLVSDRVRPAEWSSEGCSQTILLPGPVLEQLKVISQKHDATLFMLLLAAFKVLLYRYTHEPDILIGVPFAGRNQVETEPLIGCFVNTLVLRTDLSGNPRFTTLLGQVRSTCLEGFANADVPFEKVVQELKPVRSLSYNPVFQFFFATMKAAVRSHKFADLTANPYIVNATNSRFDLSVSVIEGIDDQWWIQLEYNTNLFDHERITLMLDDYKQLLLSIAEYPDKRISDLELNKDPELESNVQRC
jgi:Condensation domain